MESFLFDVCPLSFSLPETLGFPVVARITVAHFDTAQMSHNLLCTQVPFHNTKPVMEARWMKKSEIYERFPLKITRMNECQRKHAVPSYLQPNQTKHI